MTLKHRSHQSVEENRTVSRSLRWRSLLRIQRPKLPSFAQSGISSKRLHCKIFIEAKRLRRRDKWSRTLNVFCPAPVSKKFILCFSDLSEDRSSVEKGSNTG